MDESRARRLANCRLQRRFDQFRDTASKILVARTDRSVNPQMVDRRVFGALRLAESVDGGQQDCLRDRSQWPRSNLNESERESTRPRNGRFWEQVKQQRASATGARCRLAASSLCLNRVGCFDPQRGPVIPDHAFHCRHVYLTSVAEVPIQSARCELLGLDCNTPKRKGDGCWGRPWLLIVRPHPLLMNLGLSASVPPDSFCASQFRDIIDVAPLTGTIFRRTPVWLRSNSVFKIGRMLR